VKYQVVYRTEDGTAEIHSEACREWDRGDNPDDEILIDAPNPWSAAVETWSHDTAPEYLACSFTLFFPCLAPGQPRPKQRRRGKVPFDVEEDTAPEVLATLYGRVITWERDEDGKTEFASLFPEGGNMVKRRGEFVEVFPHRHTEIVHNAAGRRILKFIDAGKGRRDGSTGYRAVYLDAIVSVK
jgi:hypothetical protein